jgi:tyrosine-protein kinase Etk/Wzc
MEQKQISSEQVEDEINLLDLLMMLVKRKRLIISITLAAAVASVGYSLYLPNIYTATAKVLPPQKEGGSLTSALGQLGGLAAAAGLGGGFTGSGELYASILKSRSVADAVINQLDLMKEFKTKTTDDTRHRFKPAPRTASLRLLLITKSLKWQPGWLLSPWRSWAVAACS